MTLVRKMLKVTLVMLHLVVEAAVVVEVAVISKLRNYNIEQIHLSTKRGIGSFDIFICFFFLASGCQNNSLLLEVCTRYVITKIKWMIRMFWCSSVCSLSTKWSLQTLSLALGSADLENTILLASKTGNAMKLTFEKREELLEEFYFEPEKIIEKRSTISENEDFEEELVPEW